MRVTTVGEEEQDQKKSKKRKKQQVVLRKKAESKLLPQLVEALEELEREKRYVDIQICPKSRVRWFAGLGR